MPPKRMTANPIAPLRYRPGKAVGAQSSSSESESESDSETEQKKSLSKPTSRPSASSFPKITTDIQAREAALAAARAKDLARQRAAEEGFETASDSSGSGSDEEADSESDGGAGSDIESESSDSSDSDAAQRAKPRFVAPTFVPRHKRGAAGAEKAAERDYEDEQRVRQEKADELLKAQIERDAAAKAAARRAWDDDDDGAVDEVDDTDGVDPDAERAAWKLRELRRVKREREAIEIAEKEREEVERRRNLTAEEREAEDREFMAKQAEEKDGKGKMGFMQKYFHKGAFFQADGEDGMDDETRELLRNRDIMGARFEDDAANRELLPKSMQMRDMTKLGKKGGTRYKDLKSEDTGSWARDLMDKRPGNGPDRYRREGPSGANAASVGERRRREDDRGDGREEKRPRYDR